MKLDLEKLDKLTYRTLRERIKKRKGYALQFELMQTLSSFPNQELETSVKYCFSVQRLEQDSTYYPLPKMVTIRSNPEFYASELALLRDAYHQMVDTYELLHSDEL